MSFAPLKPLVVDDVAKLCSILTKAQEARIAAQEAACKTDVNLRSTILDQISLSRSTFRG